MASQGPLSPGTVANDAAHGLGIWTNPGEAAASDNVHAAVLLAAGARPSQYLKATNFGFTIPATATIDGIIVELERSRQGSGTIADSRIRLVRADGTVGTTDKADTTTDWNGETIITYGGATDLWGETGLVGSDINDADFGVVVSVDRLTGTSPTGRVDHIQITVHYTESGGTAHSQTITDALGGLDSVSRVADSARALTEPIGGADAASRVVGFERSATETLGLTDAVSYFLGGLIERSITDALGLRDQPGGIPIERTITDTLGATDATIQVQDYQRPATEALGLTDSISRIETSVRSVTDALGLTDPLSQLEASVRSLTDALGLTDSQSYTLFSLITRTITDNLGSVDAVTRVAAVERALTESLGITDAVARVQAVLRAIANGLGLTDQATATLIGEVSPFLVHWFADDEAGLEDSVVHELHDSEGGSHVHEF